MKLHLLVLIGLLTFSITTLGDDSEQRYEQLVDELLQVTGALKIGEQMSAMIVSHMTQWVT